MLICQNIGWHYYKQVRIGWPRVKNFVKLFILPLPFNLVSVTVRSAVIHLQPKPLYISRAMRNFYGTENEIWAGFGPVGNTEKKIGADYDHFLRVFFSCFQGQKNNLNSFKNTVVSALKSYIKWSWIWSLFFIFLTLKT